MPKKQKRVSFNVPDNTAEEEEETADVRLSIADDVDDDIDTVGGLAGRNDEVSHSSSDASSSASESEPENELLLRKTRQKLDQGAKKIARKKGAAITVQVKHGEDKSSTPRDTAKQIASEVDESSESEIGENGNAGLKTDLDADASGSSNVGTDSESIGDSWTSGEDSESDETDEKRKGEEGDTSKMEKSTRAEKAPAPITTFGEMGLDARVERAIERMGWKKPTPVQSAVIPAATAGRDVLVSAPTGSGKTAAYAIPVVQQLCQINAPNTTGIRYVILVPTRELAHQVSTVMKRMCKYIDGVRVGSVTGKNRAKGSQQGLFNMASDILIATPSALITAANKDEKNALGGVEFVVVDEADLVLSYGYEKDARTALSRIPTTSQSILLSATLDADGMDSFRKAVLRRPLTIKVTADDNDLHDDQTAATHYYARLKNHKDRYLVTYAMLRLKVICGKVLIFVNHINTAFRLKLFLDQFKLKSAVLNAELPSNSRIHCVEQFNAGVFEILIATDESKNEIAGNNSEKKKPRKATRKRRRIEKDEEFGLSRGVDFKDVAAVFNFDIPESVTKYAHRAGRTARAGKSGTVLTLVSQDKEGTAVLDMGRQVGTHIGPLAFRMDQIEALRYRVESSLRLVTDTAVHGARLADVRREIVNSDALKNYFDENPQDLDALQHNLSLAKNIPDHLGHIPAYLLPPALRGNANHERQVKHKKRKTDGPRGLAARKGSGDPLKSFSASGVAGSSRQRYRTKHGIKPKKRDLGRAIKKRKRTY